jgi:hypothetical protein
MALKRSDRRDADKEDTVDLHDEEDDEEEDDDEDVVSRFNTLTDYPSYLLM